MKKIIQLIFLVIAAVTLLSYQAFAQKQQAKSSIDTAAIEAMLGKMFDTQDTYDPLVQQHFAFDAENKIFAVINTVDNSVDIVKLEGTDSLSLQKTGKSVLVDVVSGRHDFAMIYRAKGIAIYDNHIVFLASNRDSCYLSVLTLEGEQIVKKYYGGNATSFSYSKERTELYIAGEDGLGYNIIVVNTEKGIAEADYDNASIFAYKKPKKAENIKQHDPYGIGLTVIAMGVVFLTLLMLSIIFMSYGKTLVAIQNRRSRKHAEKQGAALPGAVVSKNVEDVSGEEYAAITAAIYLYNDELHDQENTVLTIQQVSRRYSPWSAKALGLNGYFRNRK